MLKKTIAYTDYNGVSRKEDFYFNLTEAELTEMELSAEGGLEEMTKRMVASKDGAAIIQFFKDIILKSYGIKSLDGRKFEKTKEIRDDFEATPAYSILFMELATDADKGAEFINGIVPNGVDSDKLKEITHEKLAEFSE